ncbi:hypothetical protein, conserved [Trypanosoma brucei gambiense DAL972]|uniref:Regulator of chromosome condensation n=1 Tax=Trypanosoma brucei gambiense (strain MHOM/CI/86/DAL972) TaxID=679716 RepID=C9ZWM7_TRYB9|nr:hypothetical protein, conserved [Trypanosoma brucei gambiense DAL972]CBH13816.1 hypothetical protein, conserved [Trypanosoma brucei gambiense DAL972]|eukprot:XP_011776092.1 hypothetical protein, conserved [Trypanosoma brucei gambiense DAL972]
MLRRLHTRILGMGSVCGMPPSPMAEVFLKSLPPPAQVDLVKYHRFEQEEANRMRVPRCTTSPEPFYDIQSGAAGHKHVVLITREGNLITFGENRYGQSAAPGESVRGGGRLGENRQQPLAKHSDQHVSAAPMYVDLDGAFAGGNKSVACGSNYTIVYQPGGRRAIGFGNNHMGQLGIGHKNQVDASRGFAEWDLTAAWWGGNTNVIRTIACGFNHTILQLSSGELLSFGSNTWGELGIGSTVSPMQPTPIRFFEEKGIVVVKTVAGNSFTLFLTADGRVYGCGATNAGQLPANVFEPAPVLLTRSFQQGCKVVPGSVHGGPTQPKLIRIKDIACVGSMAVYASRKNELFVQGALPDYGYQVPSPRFQLVDQQPAIDYLTEMMEHNKKKGGTRWMDDKGSEAHTGFDIVRLVQGPSTLLVIYKNGCVAGLGANAEGQLQNIRRSQKGKEVNLAKAFTANGLLPVCFPSKPYEAGGKQTAALPWFTCGAGFTLLFDNNEVYDDGGQVKPIELPPPAPTSRRGAAAALRSMR